MSRVLLIDEDVATRETYADVLRSAGFDVLTAGTGQQGLSYVRQYFVDVLVTELQLPDTSGLQLLEQLGERPNPTSCVIVTARGSVESAVAAMRLGAAHYVQKPVTGEDLQTIVRTARRSVHGSVHQESQPSGVARCEPGEEIAPGNSAVPAPVRKALRRIRIEYARSSFGLRDLAQDVGVSPWYLARLLTRFTGEGFRTHLNRARIDEARRLLRQSGKTIKEIAYDVGYVETRGLDRHFKRHVGLTPSDYRRSQDLDSVDNARPWIPVAAVTTGDDSRRLSVERDVFVKED
jgi:two-component system response regulator YesN